MTSRRDVFLEWSAKKGESSPNSFEMPLLQLFSGIMIIQPYMYMYVYNNMIIIILDYWIPTFDLIDTV